MSTDITLQGTHGTSASRAKSIETHGFKKGKGRLGKGVYFWSFSPYAEYLAKSWWEFFSSQGRYNADGNKKCAIIWAQFRIKEDEFLDLDDKEIKNSLAELCRKEKIGCSIENRELAATIVCFVSKIEEKLGQKFKILESTISTPPKDFVKEYPLSVLGAPSCYVIFDPACIFLTKVTIG